jgi:hypothetical protein
MNYYARGTPKATYRDRQCTASNWRFHPAIFQNDPENVRVLLIAGCTWTSVLLLIWHRTKAAIEDQVRLMEAPHFYTYTVNKIWKINKIISIEMSDIDLSRSSDRESCPRPHLKQKQRTDYAICWLETWPRDIDLDPSARCTVSGRDRDDADLDSSVRCTVFSDDVRSNKECYAATQNDLLHTIC